MFNVIDALRAVAPITHVAVADLRVERDRREALYQAAVIEHVRMVDVLVAGRAFQGLSKLADEVARHLEWLEWEIDYATTIVGP